MAEKKRENRYTCNEYRQEMILAALQKQLRKEGLSDAEKYRLLEEIYKLEKEVGL